MTFNYAAYFGFDSGYIPEVFETINTFQSYGFEYSYFDFDFFIDLENDPWHPSATYNNDIPALSIHDLISLGEKSIYRTQLWFGQARSQFTLSFLQHNSRWFAIICFSNHELERINKHLGELKNINDFLIDVYVSLSAKNLVVSNDNVLSLEDYLKFMDGNYLNLSDISALGLFGFSKAYDEKFLKTNF